MSRGVINNTSVFAYMQSEYLSSKTNKASVGKTMRLSDGTNLIYCKAATALMAGNVVYANPTKLEAKSVSTISEVSEDTITVTATAVNHVFDNGYLCVTTGLGNKYTYSIKSHKTIGNTVMFTLNDTLIAKVDTTSKVTIISNLYNNSSSSGVIALGVSLVNIAIGEYFWVVCKGIVGAVSSEVVAIGKAVATNGTGAIKAAIAGDYIIGYTLTASVINEISPIYINI